MLFYRYISENFANYINEGEREAGDAAFDYAALSDADAEQARADLIETKGFFILPSQLFANVRKHAPLDENLNETLEAIFTAIEDSAKGSASEDDFKGLFDDMDVNSNLLGELAEKNLRLNEKLTHMGQRTTRAKLMSYFSAQAQRRGGYEFDIPFSRQQLADYLGVERSGLSLELGKMRDEGLLDFHKSHFLLKTPEADRPFPSAR